MRLKETGPQRQRAVVSRKRILQPPEFVETKAAIAQRVGVVGRDVEGLTENRHPFLRVPALQLGNAESVEELHRSGKLPQHRAVDLDRLRQMSRPVERRRLLERHLWIHRRVVHR